MWSRCRLWLRSRVAPDVVEAEIDEEIGYHLEMRARDYAARGASPQDAETLAQRRFGDVTSVRAECRELAHLERARTRRPSMLDWMQEIRHALRALAKSPGFTLVVVATVALAIGANTAIFSLVEGILLRPLPFEEPERLVSLWENDRLRGTTQERFSAPDYFDVSRENEVFEALGLFVTFPQTLNAPGAEPERVQVTLASASLFEVLGVSPVLGRTFTGEEDAPNGSPVAVLTHGFWMRRFGGDAGVLGRTLHLDGVSREIVGVLPPALDFPSRDTAIFVPAAATPVSPPRGVHNFSVVARLRRGTDLEAANANLSAIAAALEARYPDDNAGRGMWAESTFEALVGGTQERLWTLLGAVMLVLLVASVNVANLFVLRALARESEMAIRAAMGAGRRLLVRTALSESLLLSLAGGLAGLVLGWALLDGFLALVPSDLPRVANVGLNARVLAFTALLSLGTGALFGTAPALRASRRDLVTPLRESGRAAFGGSKRALRHTLVTAEIALAVALVAAAGLLIHSFVRLSRVEPGFEARGVVTTAVVLPPSRYPQANGDWPDLPAVRSFHAELLRRLEELPGVEAAALALATPVDAGFTSRFAIEGRPDEAPGLQDEVRVRAVSADYFRTLGIPVLRGRAPESRDDRSDTPPVLYVNESFVRRYFPDEDPLGRAVVQWGVRREIAGVVKDVRFRGLGEDVPPAIYPLFSQAPFAGFAVLVRSREPEERIGARIRETVSGLDRDLAISPVESLESLLARSVAAPRYTTTLFAFFGAVALALAGLGVYGVTSHSVRERTREIGLRMSLGADRRDVLGLVLGEGARMTGAGIAIGLLLAVGLGRILENLLFGVTPIDPPTLAAVALVAVAVGIVATCVPAARAARVDPVHALRAE